MVKEKSLIDIYLLSYDKTNTNLVMFLYCCNLKLNNREGIISKMNTISTKMYFGIVSGALLLYVFDGGMIFVCFKVETK